MNQGIKRVVCAGALVLLAAGLLVAKPTPEDKPIKLIVNSADAGLTHSINLGIKKTYEEGALTTCAVIVPGAFFHHFAEYARKNPGLTVGVHLAVASGLYPLPCKPVAPRNEISSIVDHQGFMFDNIKDFNANKPTYKHIKRELSAQVELAYKEGIDVAFLDNHIGNTEDIRRVITELQAEWGLPQKGGHGEIDVMELYMTPPDEAPAKMAKLIDEKITGPGTYLSRHHPAWSTPELLDLTSGNMPYAEGEFAAYRDGEAKAIMSPEVKAVIKKRDIQLIGFYKEERDKIRAAMPDAEREALLKRIKDLKRTKYGTPEGPYVFEGTPAVIAKAAKAITIDGNLKEFKKAAAIVMDGTSGKTIFGTRKATLWDGKKDLNADARILYDDTNIYLGLKVTDNKGPVNDAPAYEIYQGDNFELYINTDAAKTDVMRGMVKIDKADNKFTFSGTCKDGKPVVVCQGAGVVTDKVEMSFKDTKDGYIIEAAIPRTLLKTNDWKTGDKLRFDVAISDYDEAGKMRSKIWWNAQNKAAWQNPNFWGVAEIK